RCSLRKSLDLNKGPSPSPTRSGCCHKLCTVPYCPTSAISRPVLSADISTSYVSPTEDHSSFPKACQCDRPGREPRRTSLAFGLAGRWESIKMAFFTQLRPRQGLAAVEPL